MGKYIFVIAMLITGVACVQVQVSHAQQTDTVQFDTTTVGIGDKEYEVEYAKTFEQRAQGLMFRKELCEDCGMLFKFNASKYAGMWMKNTFIPLDVAFIDRNGVITDIKPLTPHSLESVGSSKKVRYALEMNQGWFANHNIAVGDRIVIDH